MSSNKNQTISSVSKPMNSLSNFSNCDKDSLIRFNSQATSLAHLSNEQHSRRLKKLRDPAQDSESRTNKGSEDGSFLNKSRGEYPSNKFLVWGIPEGMADDVAGSLISAVVPPPHKALSIRPYALEGWRVCECASASSAEYLLSIKSFSIKKRVLAFEPFFETEELKQQFLKTADRRVLLCIKKTWVSKNRIKESLESFGVFIQKIYILFSKTEDSTGKRSGPTHKNFSVLVDSPESAQKLIQKSQWSLKTNGDIVVEAVPFRPHDMLSQRNISQDESSIFLETSRIGNPVQSDHKKEKLFLEKPTRRSYYAHGRRDLDRSRHSGNEVSLNLCFRVNMSRGLDRRNSNSFSNIPSIREIPHGEGNRNLQKKNFSNKNTTQNLTIPKSSSILLKEHSCKAKNE